MQWHQVSRISRIAFPPATCLPCAMSSLEEAARRSAKAAADYVALLRLQLEKAEEDAESCAAVARIVAATGKAPTTPTGVLPPPPTTPTGLSPPSPPPPPSWTPSDEERCGAKECIKRGRGLPRDGLDHGGNERQDRWFQIVLQF